MPKTKTDKIFIISTRMTPQVWSHVYGRDNLNVAPEDHAVLLTEAPLNPYKNRRQCAETFFENFGVPAMFCAPQVSFWLLDILRF